MRWFRAQGRASAWVALFALLVQFAVSFGHVHVDHVRTAAPAITALEDHQSAPDSDHADPYCAICILNQMVGTAQTAAPPGVLLTLVSHITKRTFVSERMAVEPPPSAFRSRAPPLA